MQMQLKLSGTGNNHLELAKVIIQHLDQGRTRQIDPLVRPEPSTTVQNRQEASITLPHHQGPFKTCQIYAKAASTILNWEDSSTTGHNQLAGSR